MAISSQHDYRKTDYAGIWIAIALVIVGAIVFAAYSTYDADTVRSPYVAETPAGNTVIPDTTDEGYVPTLTEE